MSYIGNTATQQAFTPAVDFFNGNGSTVAFTLSRPVASVAQVQAVISNVPQKPGDAFTVSGNTITFTSAPPSGTQNIYVYYTSPITQVIQPGQGTVSPSSMTAGAPTWSQTGGVSLPRVDSSAEGGQLNLNRSSDDTNAWALDVYGSGSTPAMRVLDLVNNAEVMRWNQSGTIILKGASTSATGTGIAFPAAQSASSDANTLDDYEEGTWTPVVAGLSGGTPGTYGVQSGYYTKIGRTVNIGVFVSFTKGTLAGALIINNMPFVSNGNQGANPYVFANWYLPGGTAPVIMIARQVENTSNVYLFRNTAANIDATATQLTASDLHATNASNISFYFTYTV